MSHKIQIAGVPFDTVTFQHAVSTIAGLLQSPKQSLLVTPNPEMVVAAQADPDFKSILNSAALSVPDGIGIIWASYFLSLPQHGFFTLISSLMQLVQRRPAVFSQLPERVTGTDLFPEILRLAAAHDLPVFLLGAADGVAAAAAAKLNIPNLQVATFSGSPQLADEAEIITNIQRSGAVVLIVAYGAPAQEKWLARNLPKLTKVKLAAGLGGAFDFHAGHIRRAPAVFRSLGLEWLWRLFRQPQRAGRIWAATGRFIRVIWRCR